MANQKMRGNQMAEKKVLKKITERLKHFEEYEQKCAVKLLAMKDSYRFDERVLDIVGSLRRKEYMEKPGDLAVLYLTYIKYSEQVPMAKRNEPEYLDRKYWLYIEALSDMEEYPKGIYRPDEYLDREAVFVTAEINEAGEERYSDLFNAKMMTREYGSEIRFCGPWKKWVIWDGRRWKRDDENLIYQMGIDTIRGMYKKSIPNKTKDEAMAMMEHAGRSESVRKIEAMIKAAAWNKDINILPEILDRHSFIFNCRNGMIDLHSGRLLPHEKERMITKISPVKYDPEADCPVWKKFLKEIFDKNKDLINFIQRALGWALTGDNGSQAMFILYGNGANGKSTFINTVMKLMGDYATSTPTETFMQKKGDQASNDIARLKGTRFVSAMEAEYGGKLAEAVVKRLTGDDVISARFLYGEFFDFLPTFKIFMATNHKPKIGGTDNAIWRRIRMIPFEVSFSENKQDRKLSEKLENELPGILAWIVEGTLKWQKEGLGSAPAILEATSVYRQEMSAIETFLEEMCVKNPTTMVKSLFLYNAYKKWCEENNERVLSARGFGIRLGESGMDKVRLSKGFHWLGIELRE
jgi:putative DNA primase/helicase